MKNFLLTSLILVGGSAVAGIEWNGYRGPDRDGRVRDSDWTHWIGESPATLWEAQVGKGYSAVVVHKGYAVTMGNQSGVETVYRLDAENGEVRWAFTYDCPEERKSFFGPRSTPAVDDDYVFTMSWNGQMHCVNARSGQLVWKKSLPDVGVNEEFGFSLPNWGLACSPLIHEDTVVYDVGRIVALDRKTGDIKWSTDDFNAAYSSPVVLDVNGKPSIACFMRRGLVVVEAETGALLSKYPWNSNGDVNAAMPLLHEGRIFLSSFSGPGCALISPTPPEVTVIWQNTNLANNVSSGVLHDSYLYGFDGQVSDSGGELRCLDIRTGELKWRHEGLGVGALSLAGRRLLILSESGELLVARPNPDSFQPLARAKVLPGTCWTAPTFDGGRIYCRDSGGKVVCIDVRNPEPRGFVGDTGSGWDTRSGVSVRASSEKKSREAIYTIDGGGFDPTGRFHVNYLNPTSPPPGSKPYPYEHKPDCTMWLSGGPGADGAVARGGTVEGGEWIEFSFKTAVPLREMWIWNYNENNHPERSDGIPPHYYWSASGMRDIVIQYSETGGSRPEEWQTVYEGELPCAYGHLLQPGDLRVDFGGAKARYVVITSADDGHANWVEEKLNIRNNVQVGLSEVRFYPADKGS